MPDDLETGKKLNSEGEQDPEKFEAPTTGAEVEQLDEEEPVGNYQIENKTFNKEEEDQKLAQEIEKLFTGKEMPYTYKQTKLEDYVNEFMAARIGMANILEKLRGKIDNGYFTSLIGDDASGRVPGYILFRALGKINMSQGRKPLKITFLAGGKEVDDGVWRDIKDGVGKMKDDFGDHPLMITDRISGAYTIFHYVRAFKDNGLDLDIAAMQSWDDKIPARFHRDEESGDIDADIAGKEIISGLNKDVYESEDFPKEYRYNTNAFYMMKELSGREKDPYGTYPRESKKHGHIWGFSRRKEFSGGWNDVSLVNEGKEASRLVADVLVREYLLKERGK